MSEPTSPGGMAPTLTLLASALILLVAFGAVEVARPALSVYVLSTLVHAAVYLIAIAYVTRRPARGLDLLLILCIAVLLRAFAMTASGSLPVDAVLAHLSDASSYPGIRQNETALAIHPPVAQMLFALANRLSDSFSGIRIVTATAEAVTIVALLAWLKIENLPRERVLIYAWHPLPIWEFSAMGHIDSAAIALAVLAIVAVVRRYQAVGGSLLAAAVATNYFPIVLAPALWRRGGWSMPLAFVLTLAAVYLPYAWQVGSGVLGPLWQYLDHEGYRSGHGFHLLQVLRDLGIKVPDATIYVAAALLALLAVEAWTLFARGASEVRPQHLVIVAAAFVLAASPHYAWWFGWLVPLLVLYRSPSVICFTLLALLLNAPDNGAWATRSFYYSVIFGGFAMLAIVEMIWRRRYPLAFT